MTERIAMGRTVSLLAFSFAGLVASMNALAQNPADDTKAIRSLLLRPAGWMFEWKPGPKGETNGPEDNGNGEMLFRARGSSLRVKISNAKLRAPCENDAIVNGDSVTFDGCILMGITLRYDPTDNVYPFKGASPLYEFRMKPK